MTSDAPSARDVALVAAAKACVSVAVLGTGFRAVSDDDFARIVIAQRFAADPALDPTGTSWLPLPFWLQGGVMLLFGRAVEVARATSFVLGIGAAVLVLVAARFAGVSRRGAIAGAIIASAIPYAAWLGVATVPDYPAAALIVLGVASATSESPRRRAVGALALGLAALCRYEAWPVAAGFALLCALEAARARAARLALPALFALAGPALWLAHGAATHGDALFFVTRVADYKRAVGGALPVLQALVHQPLAVLRCEPELALAAIVAVGTTVATGHARMLRRHARPGALLGLLLVFLVAGELRASGATHHAERAVLAIWLWLAVFVADLASELWPVLAPRARGLSALLLAIAVGAGALVVRPWYARRDSFIDRSVEMAFGKRAAELATDSDRLLVDTPDFAFFAIIAGFAAPERAEPIDDRDPRRRPERDPFESEAALRARIGDTRWLIVTDAHRELGSKLGTARHSHASYTLLELRR